MKTSMMDLQTSTLTLSFWNMSRNGRKRSWERATTDGTVKPAKLFITDYMKRAKSFRCVGVCSPLRRGQRSCGSRWGSSWSPTAAAEQNKHSVFTEERQALCFMTTQCVGPGAAHLRVGILKRPVGGHVFDDVSQNGVDLTFLGGIQIREEYVTNLAILLDYWDLKSETSDIHLKKHQSKQFSVGLSLGNQ